tara:strand:- start:208 stop:444 length:237 start_codon:yes stop_codon:yes gene_type:complete
MMDDEFEMGGMVLVQNDGKTIQELAMEFAVTLCTAYEKQMTAEGLAFKVVEVARIFEAYLEEGYENQPEADVISLKEV